MNFRIDWIDGAPKEVERGMVVKCSTGKVYLIGDGEYWTYACEWLCDIVAYGYLIKPHELEWIADMAQRHGKGRPEQ